MPTLSTKPEPMDTNTRSERGQVWYRLQATAMRHHGLKRLHGLNTIIGHDAGRSSQTVGDWKHERSAVPQEVIKCLAETYGVTERYLMCHTNSAAPERDLSPSAARARMNEMVNRVLALVNVNVPLSDVVKMCDVALTGLLQGQDDALIYGTVLMQVMDAAQDSPSTAQRETANASC